MTDSSKEPRQYVADKWMAILMLEKWAVGVVTGLVVGYMIWGMR